jgi:cell division transport system permease protein
LRANRGLVESPSAVIARLGFFLRQALSALGRSLGITVLAVMTIGVALTVLSTFFAIVSNLARVVDELGREVEISAYLKNGTVPAVAQKDAAEIGRWAGVAGVRFLSSDRALEEFKATLGKDAIVLQGLPADVLPPSLEVRLDPRAWTVLEVRGIAEKLEKLEAVEDVRFGQEDIERVNALLKFARIAALVMTAALAFATILIISNTIRLTVYARRDEIEIMSLVGATNAFVRAPFVLEGMIQGLLGGFIALGVLLAFENALKVGIERGLQYAYGPIQLQFVPMEYLGYLLFAGMMLGLVGSLLAVGKFLKV